MSKMRKNEKSIFENTNLTLIVLAVVILAGLMAYFLFGGAKDASETNSAKTEEEIIVNLTSPESGVFANEEVIRSLTAPESR